MNPDKLHSFYKIESNGGKAGWFTLEIKGNSKFLPEKIDWDWLNANPEFERSLYEAKKILENALIAVSIKHNPEAMEDAKHERETFLAMFPVNSYVEEIPNGYCSDGCCKHLPWFIVTTSKGRIKIGWRKSVINIDWSDTKGTKTSCELFLNENVTMGDKYIHAWGCDKAKAYIKAILA